MCSLRGCHIQYCQPALNLSCLGITYYCCFAKLIGDQGALQTCIFMTRGKCYCSHPESEKLQSEMNHGNCQLTRLSLSIMVWGKAQGGLIVPCKTFNSDYLINLGVGKTLS